VVGLHLAQRRETGQGERYNHATPNIQDEAQIVHRMLKNPAGKSFQRFQRFKQELAASEAVFTTADDTTGLDTTGLDTTTPGSEVNRLPGER